MFGQTGDQRLAVIQPSLRGEFVARAGGANGHIPLQAARSLLTRFFSREHGWLIKGLEPAEDSTGHGEALHEVDVLHDMAPVLAEKLSAAGRSMRGLALKDV